MMQTVYLMSRRVVMKPCKAARSDRTSHGMRADRRMVKEMKENQSMEIADKNPRRSTMGRNI